MKSLRIEFCPSGFISMSFSLYSLWHDYLFGMTWLCQIDKFLRFLIQGFLFGINMVVIWF